MTPISLGVDGEFGDGSASSYGQSVSHDGRYIAFESIATNLVAGDNNGQRDVFVRDLLAGTTSLVSVGLGGETAGGVSDLLAISGNGRFVFFASSADDITTNDQNGLIDIFVRDLELGTTELVTVNQAGFSSSDYGLFPNYTTIDVTPDGRYFAFLSVQSDLIGIDTEGRTNVFVRDLLAGTTTLASANLSGEAGNGDLFSPVISDDGRFVGFISSSSDLTSNTLANGQYNVFVRDMVGGMTTLVSETLAHTSTASGAYGIAMSADGRYVAFANGDSNLVGGGIDTNATYDVFIRDMLSGEISLVSSGLSGFSGNGSSGDIQISSDGRFVAFGSSATDLTSIPDNNGTNDVFVRDLQLGVTQLVTADSSGTEASAQGAFGFRLNVGGTKVAYVTYESLVAEDQNGGFWDVYVRDLATGTASLVATTPDGISGDYYSDFPQFDFAGNVVVFMSGASDLAPGGTQGVLQVYAAFSNSAPQNLEVSIDATSIDENGVVLLAAQFVGGDVLPGDHYATIDWGDGTIVELELLAGITEISGQSHDYLDNLPGDMAYEVIVTIVDSYGEFVQATTSITVNNVAPVPTIHGAPAASAEGTAIALTGTATDASPVDQADVLTLAWSVTKNGLAFGSPATGSDFSFTPDDNGSYVATLTATDKDGGSAATSVTIDVLNALPTITVNPSLPVNEGSLAVVSVANPVDPGVNDTAAGFRYAFAWDGLESSLPTTHAAASVATSSSFAFNDNGEKTVLVRIFDQDSGHSTYSTLVTVNNVAPSAVFNAPRIVDTGAPVMLSLSSSMDISIADTAAGFRYSFAFDGQDSSLATTYAAADTLSTASSSFPTLGTYTVKGRVFDKDGGFSTYAADIVVFRTTQINTSSTNGVAVSASGTAVVVGSRTYPGDPSGQNTTVNWVNSLGSNFSTTTFTPTGNDTATAVAADATGVYVVGTTNGWMHGRPSIGGQDAFIFKVGANGGFPLWTIQFGSTDTDQVIGVAADSSGVYVVGTTSAPLPGQTSAGAFIRKYGPSNGTSTSAPTLLWTKRFGTGSDTVNGVAVDATGVYVVGYTYGTFSGQTSLGGADAFILKYNASGGALWTKQFGTSSGDYAFGIATDASGVYVVGKTQGTLPGQANAGAQDAFIRKFNVNGVTLWTNQFGSSKNDDARDVVVNATGVYVVGTTIGTLPGQVSAGLQDAFIRKYGIGGNVLWTNQFGTPSNEAVTGAAVDATGVYVVGTYYGGQAYLTKFVVNQTYVGGGGHAINGYLIDATAFLDANFNGELDPTEPWSVTDAIGGFDVQVPAALDSNGNGLLDDSEGQWVVFGGIDSSTGLPAVSKFIAPASWSVVTPLTTLVSSLVAQYGLSLTDASTRVREALGLPAVDLATLDPIAATLAGDTVGSQVFAAHARIQDTIAQSADLLASTAGAPPRADLVAALVAEIAAQIATPGATLDLSDGAVIEAMLHNVGTNSGILIAQEIVAGAAEVIAAGNELLDAIPLTGDVAYVTQVAEVKLVSQGAVAEQLSLAAQGAVDIAQVVAENTGAALESQVATAAIPPTIVVPADISVSLANALGTAVDFSVSAFDLTGQPVPVVTSWNSGDLFPVGTTTVSVVATDSLGATSTATFVVTVLANRNPTLLVDNTSVAVDADQTALNFGTFEDLDGHPVSLSASLGVVTQEVNGFWTWSYDATSGPLTETVMITATDEFGGVATTSFELVVNGLSPGAAIVDGVLRVVGTEGNDQVSLTMHNANTIRVQADFVPASERFFNLSDVSQIEILLRGGNDQATIAGSILVSATIDGGEGDDILKAGGGATLLLGGGGDDTLRGGDNDDVIVDLVGNNVVHAGRGNDVVTMGAGNDAIWTGDGDDSVNAGDGNNEIHASGGNDEVVAGSGHDLIWTDGDNDTIDAGDGNNEIRAGKGNNFITAGNGNDLIWANGGDDTINAGDGDNEIHSGRGRNLITTGSGHDQIWTRGDDDTIHAGDGNNVVRAGGGINYVTTGSGNDHIYSGNGNDVIDAGDGDNVVQSGGGNDDITTGFGNDVIDAGAGDDLVRAGAGNDVVDGGSGDDRLVGGDGDDTIMGRGGRDIIIGGRGADILIGNQDEDLLIAGWTAFDDNPAALGQIVLEWASPRSYVDRVKNLSGDTLSTTFGSRQNANYFLVGEDQPNQTVFDDSDIDRLTGSQATDWYFASLGAGGTDLITDLARLEQTVDIEL